jgi:hypothetical protein
LELRAGKPTARGVLSTGESGVGSDSRSDVEGVGPIGDERNEENSDKPNSRSNEDKRVDDHSPSSLGPADKDRRGGAIGARTTGELGASNLDELGSLRRWDGISCSDEFSENTER